MSLKSIEEAIDLPLMDTKNISNLIHSYIKYNIVDVSDIYYVKIELNSFIDSETTFLYCKIYDCYYLLFLHHKNLYLINDKMCLNEKPNNIVPVYEDENAKEKYIFVKELDYFCNKKNYYYSYEILRTFKTKEECNKYLYKDLITYKNLFINGLFPSSKEEFDYFTIWYNNETIFTLYGNNNDDENEDENLEIKEKGKELENLINKIINLL